MAERKTLHLCMYQLTSMPWHESAGASRARHLKDAAGVHNELFPHLAPVKTPSQPCVVPLPPCSPHSLVVARWCGNEHRLSLGVRGTNIVCPSSVCARHRIDATVFEIPGPACRTPARGCQCVRSRRSGARSPRNPTPTYCAWVFCVSGCNLSWCSGRAGRSSRRRSLACACRGRSIGRGFPRGSRRSW